MNTIEWTKAFRVHHERGEFRLFISKHRGSGFYASLLHYERGRDASQLHPVTQFFLHTEFGNPEQQAIDKIETWMKQSLPGRYSMEQMPNEEVALNNAEPQLEETSEVSDEIRTI